MNDVSIDIEEIADPNRPDIFQDPSPTPAAERDDLFYFETVTFQVRFYSNLPFAFYATPQVEDKLFRVIKSDFEVQGTPFEVIFSLPQAPRKLVEGTDDSCPFYLHGISKVSFRSFLGVLYPL
jgi:hypothetical protein